MIVLTDNTVSNHLVIGFQFFFFVLSNKIILNYHLFRNMKKKIFENKKTVIEEKESSENVLSESKYSQLRKKIKKKKKN